MYKITTTFLFCASLLMAQEKPQLRAVVTKKEQK